MACPLFLANKSGITGKRTAASTAVAAMGVERLVEVFSPRVAAQAGTKLNTVKSPLTTTGEN
jgi:hypothetical protein